MRTLVALTFSAFARVCSAQGEPSIQPAPAQEDRNRPVATRVFEEIFNQGRFEAASEIYALEFRNPVLSGTSTWRKIRLRCTGRSRPFQISR
jgi:hypothetical protein